MSGPPGQDRDIWLPHDLLPIGSPVFYAALVIIPIIIYYNETTDAKLKTENERLREERLERRQRRSERQTREREEAEQEEAILQGGREEEQKP